MLTSILLSISGNTLNSGECYSRILKIYCSRFDSCNRLIVGLKRTTHGTPLPSHFPPPLLYPIPSSLFSDRQHYKANGGKSDTELFIIPEINYRHARTVLSFFLRIFLLTDQAIYFFFFSFPPTPSSVRPMCLAPSDGSPQQTRSGIIDVWAVLSPCSVVTLLRNSCPSFYGSVLFHFCVSTYLTIVHRRK